MSIPDDVWATLPSRASDVQWAQTRRDFTVGQVVRARVLSRARFGLFVELDSGVLGLVEIIRVADPGVMLEDDELPPVGEEITAVVLDFSEGNRQVRLSTRPVDLAEARSHT